MARPTRNAEYREHRCSASAITRRVDTGENAALFGSRFGKIGRITQTDET